MKTFVVSLLLGLISTQSFAGEIEYGAIKQPIKLSLTSRYNHYDKGYGYQEKYKANQDFIPTRLFVRDDRYLVLAPTRDNEVINTVPMEQADLRRLNYYLIFTSEDCPTNVVLQNNRIVKVENACAQNLKN